MSSNKSQPLIGIILTALSLLLVVGLLTFAGPCVGVARAALGVGAVAFILSVVRIFERDEGERRGLCLGVALTGALVACMPSLLADMDAGQVTGPFCLAVGAATALIAGADLTRRLMRLIPKK